MKGRNPYSIWNSLQVIATNMDVTQVHGGKVPVAMIMVTSMPKMVNSSSRRKLQEKASTFELCPL